jgi:PKHD-type hydroxylase
MNLKIKYWYWQNAIPSHMCDHIIKIAKEQKEQFAVVGHNENKKLTKQDIENQKKQIRDSNVVWFKEPWLFDLLSRYFFEANKNAEWNFEYHQIEPVQFTIYKKNQYYGWHQDSDFYSNQNPVRKLSCVVCLSDPQDFEGGNFRINLMNIKDCSNNVLTVPELKGKGNLIVFPSQLWHEVEKITKGLRYSLVAWASGDPFK